MASLDYFFLEQKLIDYAALNFAQGVVSILLIYIIGQIISVPSAWILESLVANKILKEPCENLFQPDDSLKGYKRFFHEYYKSFSKEEVDKILRKFDIKDKVKPDEKKYRAIHQLVLSRVKTNETAFGQLSIYLNLYGFARNVSFTCFILSIILLIKSIYIECWNNTYWILALFLAGLILFYKFLKFYRYYSYDMYLSFLSISEESNSE